MQLRVSIQRARLAASVVCSLLLLVAFVPSAFAQATEPPLDIAIGKLPARDPNAITIEGWLLYPTLKLYSTDIDNFFFSPQNSLSVVGLGVAPGLTAEWTNGIHTTTLYGNLDRQVYPTDNQINSLIGRAGFSQRYEALRDLIFTANGDFIHQTLATSLQNSIQTPSATPTTTILPNGNTVLPNGTILSPSGQPVGQVNQSTGTNAPVFVNPSNTYTGTFSVEKIFNRGILDVTASANRTIFENQTQGNLSARTLTESTAFWLGPALFAYSNGSIGTVVTDATAASSTSSTSTAYRVIGGIGTRQIGLWRGSVYFGHQGSQINTTAQAASSVTAGGDIYGGAISYYPTPQLTFTGTVERTVNISSSPAAATNLALTLPTFSTVQVPLTSSTRITSTSLQTTYEIAPLWSLTGQLGYVRIEFLGSPVVTNSWLLDTTLRYEILRSMTLAWEYRYKNSETNAPFSSAKSNFVMMSAIYKF